MNFRYLQIPYKHGIGSVGPFLRGNTGCFVCLMSMNCLTSGLLIGEHQTR